MGLGVEGDCNERSVILLGNWNQPLPKGGNSLFSRLFLSRFWRDRQGGLSLEAAVVTPLISILLVTLCLLLYTRWAQFCFHTAANKASQELRLTALLAGRAFEQIPLEGEAVQEWNKLPPSVRGMALEGALTAWTGQAVGKRVNTWYSKTIRQSRLLEGILQNRKFSLSWDGPESLLWIHSSYETPLFLGRWNGSDRTPIPLWIDWPEAPVEAQDGEEKADNFWSWHNFKRGKYLREKYGGNLPDNYPVISGFQGDTAVMIRSMDLTAPTWQSQSALQLRIQQWAMELERFQGTEKPWGREKIHIRSGSIHQRVLTLIVPENSPATSRGELERIRDSMAGQGIHLQIVFSEKSYRYQKNAKEKNKQTEG